MLPVVLLLRFHLMFWFDFFVSAFSVCIFSVLSSLSLPSCADGTCANFRLSLSTYPPPPLPQFIKKLFLCCLASTALSLSWLLYTFLTNCLFFFFSSSFFPFFFYSLQAALKVSWVTLFLLTVISVSCLHGWIDAVHFAVSAWTPLLQLLSFVERRVNRFIMRLNWQHAWYDAM